MSAQTQGPGTWFDGTAGVPQSVTLTLEEGAVAVASAEGAPLARWDYAAVERLPAPEHRLRLALAGSPSTARLEVRDPAFAEAVKARLDVRTMQVDTGERRRRHRVVEWSLAAVAAVVLIGVFGLPAIADLLVPFIPFSAEAEMGLGIHEAHRRRFKEKGPFECGDAGEKERAGKAVFLKMFGRLEAAAGLPIALHPFVVRTRVVNASAMPGGYVHINKGIIGYVDSPDELGVIIAHELGHVAHRDTMRALLHEAGVSYLFGAVLGDVIGGGGMAVAALRVLNNRYSRAEEAAADAFGVALMNKVGADSQAFAAFFERGMRRSKSSRRMLIFYDHPPNAARLVAVRASPAVPNPKPLLTAEEWQTLKQVCSEN